MRETITAPPLTWSRAFPATPAHVSAVRAGLRPLLDGCPVADDVLLCASEMAANAALHSHSALPGGQFTVRAEIHPGGHARVEVDDGGGPWTEPDPDPSRGHGLDIIRALATDWGIGGNDSGRTIWAHFTWPGPHSQPHPEQP